MMAENREGLGMKVIAVMVQRYGVLPRELWDLNSVSDMRAARGLAYSSDALSTATYASILSNDRYSIVNLTLGYDVSHKVELPGSLRQLMIRTLRYDFALDLLDCPYLQELVFDRACMYNQPLVLPSDPRRLGLGFLYNQPLNLLPHKLVELEMGSQFSQPLLLPPRLTRLEFPGHSVFNLPVALPPCLRRIRFGDSYNQATVLPDGIDELRIGSAFSHDLSLPNSLRKLEWRCNRPVRLPDGVVELDFGVFNHPITFPPGLKRVKFISTYTHPLSLPDGLEELSCLGGSYDGLVLPDGLRKLSWLCGRNIRLPSGLRKLSISGGVPLVLPEGLLKIQLGGQVHYDLPASVQEVSWLISTSKSNFTHPTTLQHLIVEYDLSHNKINKVIYKTSLHLHQTVAAGIKGAGVHVGHRGVSLASSKRV